MESLDICRELMLGSLCRMCERCILCELGRQMAVKGDLESRDPHVFSSMTTSRFFALGQNPGWDELQAATPFVGAAGRNFDAALAKNQLSRQHFYITNICKCFTKDNAKPPLKCVEACSRFLEFEVAILRPKLIVTLGAVPFNYLCPGSTYSSCLGKITKAKLGNVYAVYHPSPRNLSDKSRAQMFQHQMSVLCELIKRLLNEV